MNIICQNQPYVGRTHLSTDDAIHKLLQTEIDNINSNLSIIQNDFNYTVDFIDSNLTPLTNLINTEYSSNEFPSYETINTYIYNNYDLGEIRFWVKSTSNFPPQFPIGIPDYRVKIDIDGHLKVYYTMDTSINLTWGNGWIDVGNMLVGAVADSVNQGLTIGVIQGELLALKIYTDNMIGTLYNFGFFPLMNEDTSTILLEQLNAIQQGISTPTIAGTLRTLYYDLNVLSINNIGNFFNNITTAINLFVNNNPLISFAIGSGGTAVAIAYGLLQNQLFNGILINQIHKSVSDNSNISSNNKRTLYDQIEYEHLSCNLMYGLTSNFYLNKEQGFINSNILTTQTINQIYAGKIGIGGITPDNSIFPLDVVGSINADNYYRSGVQQFIGTSNQHSNLNKEQGFINSNILTIQTIPKIYTNNIGIGTTNPNVKIDIRDGTMTDPYGFLLPTQLRVLTGTTNINSSISSAIAYFGNISNTYGIAISQNGIATYGSESIQDLHIKNTSTSGKIYFRIGSIAKISINNNFIENSTYLKQEQAIIIKDPTFYEPFLDFTPTNANWGTSVKNDHRILYRDNNLIFQTKNNATAEMDVLTIIGNGNVGIGIASSIYKLNVAGTINSTNYYKNDILQFIGTETENSNLALSQGFINSNILTNQIIQQIYGNKIGLGINPDSSTFPLDVIGSINADNYYRSGVKQFVGTATENYNLSFSQGFINSNVLTEQYIRTLKNVFMTIEGAEPGTAGGGGTLSFYNPTGLVGRLCINTIFNQYLTETLENDMILRAYSGSNKIHISASTRAQITIAPSNRIGVQTATPRCIFDITNDINITGYNQLLLQNTVLRVQRLLPATTVRGNDTGNVIATFGSFGSHNYIAICQDGIMANGSSANYNLNLQAKGDGNIYLRTNNTDTITVAPLKTTISNTLIVNNLIGIGTSEPSYKLEVVNGAITGTNNSPTLIRVAGNATSSIDNTNNPILALFGNKDTSKGLAICENGIITSGSTANQDLNLQATGNANIYLRTNNTQLITINSTSTTITTDFKINGNSGLGTDISSSYKLNVGGNINLNPTTSTAISFSGFGYSLLGLNGTANSYAGNSDIGDMVLRTNTSKKLHLTCGLANPTLTVSGLNVGIGRTDPQVLLHANGTIRARNASQAYIEMCSSDSAQTGYLNFTNSSGTVRALFGFETDNFLNLYAYDTCEGLANNRKLKNEGIIYANGGIEAFYLTTANTVSCGTLTTNNINTTAPQIFKRFVYNLTMTSMGGDPVYYYSYIDISNISSVDGVNGLTKIRVLEVNIYGVNGGILIGELLFIGYVYIRTNTFDYYIQTIVSDNCSLALTGFSSLFISSQNNQNCVCVIRPIHN